MFGRLRRGEKVSETLAREIVTDIADRKLDAGARLPSEADMLERYGVGRGSLREALRILEVNGLISIRPGPGGGPVVDRPTSANFGRMASLYYHLMGATFRELLDARLSIEPMMAAQAARRQDADVMGRLHAVILSAHEAEDNDEEYLQHSSEFHEVICGISGNKVLDLFARAIKDVWTERVTGMLFSPDMREKVRRDHETIGQAIIDADAAKAERLMRAHMVEFGVACEAKYPGLLNEVVVWA